MSLWPSCPYLPTVKRDPWPSTPLGSGLLPSKKESQPIDPNAGHPPSGVCCEFRSPASQPPGQVKPRVCKRRSHQSPQAGCPSWFPDPKPRCSEDGFSFSLFLYPAPDQNMLHKCWLNTPLRGKVLQNGKREVRVSPDLLSVPGSVLGKGMHSSSGPVVPCVSMVLSLILHSHIFPPLGLSITKNQSLYLPQPHVYSSPVPATKRTVKGCHHCSLTRHLSSLACTL